MPSAAASQSTWMLGDVPGVERTASGQLVDFLDPGLARPDLPEERVRQYYARVLVDEYNYAKDCMALGAPVAIGSETKFADIVVYTSPEACQERAQGQILLVVETKAPNRTEGRAQLVSYIFASSAQGGVWTNGGEIAYFRRLEHPAQNLKEWTNIPRAGETWDTVGHYRKDQLKPPRELKQVFQRCHNAIYRSGADSEDVAFDMVRLILAKYRDEQNVGDVCQFRCTPEEYGTAEGRRKVGDRIHGLFKQVVKDHPDVFPPGEEITIGNDNLATVVNELQPFRFLADDETEQVYDVIGTAFEVYVAAHLKGARGQYFTNRLVVNLMVQMMDPSERDVIYDPACGSGGFLIACLRHVRTKILGSSRTRAAMHREVRQASERLFGSDIAPKLVRVAKTNMILNGDGHGGIIQANALRDPKAELPETYPLHPEAKGRQTPTMIFTNPPFGASYELREKSRDVLRLYRLGHSWEPDARGTLQPTANLVAGDGVPPEILFLERCIELLAPGGRLAIVIARGVLDNRETLAARTYLLRETRLLAVINCHPNTFAPFNGTKASVLIVERKKTPGIQRDENYPVFMAISQRVGQDSQGREIYKTDPNGDFVVKDGQRVLDHDLGEIAAAWQAFQAGRPIAYHAAWTVPLKRIIESPELRFNPVRFAPSAEQAYAHVLELADSDTWRVERLGDIANVFNGPRFKRPFADAGVTTGPGIVRMYTPKAFFEERGESVKYLDVSKASRTQKRQLDVLTLRRDWILIVDSGTAGKLLGKVGMVTAVQDGAIGNNNLIRVVIENPALRDYIYQFLRSELGQALLLKNVYGTNQDHIEPEDAKDVPIPIPRDEARLALIHEQVRRLHQLREDAATLDADVRESLGGLFAAMKGNDRA
jgi:type I restriction enzyme M protein